MDEVEEAIYEYIILADTLPKNPSGKILKRELRRQHAGLAAAEP
jgi:fatty-acyl-CoA synthase